MRPVDHLAVERKHARIGSGGLERRDDAAGMGDAFGGGREDAVDDGHLTGMDRHLAREPVAHGRDALRLQSVQRLDVREDGVDGLDAGGRSAEQRQAARQAEDVRR